MTSRILIELFDPARHDRSSFSSGIVAVDNYLHKTANKLSKADNVRVFVMTFGGGIIVGYFALNAHAVSHTDLPEKFGKARPGHGNIPAIFIAMMGVDHRHAGKGHGGDLLTDALQRIERTSREVGVSVAVLDVLDCGNPTLVARRMKFYRSFGFSPFSSDPMRLYLPVASVRSSFAREP